MQTADHPHPDNVRWIGVADAQALRQVAYRRILDAAARAIERRGRFLIVLAGGSTPRGIYRMLCSADAAWSRWHVYLGGVVISTRGDPESARNAIRTTKKNGDRNRGQDAE